MVQQIATGYELLGVAKTYERVVVDKTYERVTSRPPPTNPTAGGKAGTLTVYPGSFANGKALVIN